ncbi:PF11300 domain protein [Leptospira kirschneri str. 200803703]|uniref:DUF3102 domain-containing protein n=1 Tax=Leptospira kirschneri TaxID=29507 RepID=UPI0002BFCBF7|nr:DUF3102 domain-containing protein [Leptospira kirschneri]EMO67143.1 PF11300 domain protein [Leptospira kirschneri str. 200803703]
MKSNSIKEQKIQAFLTSSKVNTVPATSISLVEPDIDEIADKINKLVEGAENDFKNGMLKYIAAGEMLIKQKESMPYGEFTAWQKKNLTFSIPSASIYMKFAKYKIELTKSKEKTIRGARILIKELEDASNPNPKTEKSQNKQKLFDEPKMYYKKFLSGEKLSTSEKRTVKLYLKSEIENIKDKMNAKINKINNHISKL